jgi:orotidine-5'-phosphate decarboxylase
MRSFAERFHGLADEVSPFCLGIDPAPASLKAAGLADDVAGLRRFCEGLIGAAAGLTALVKPQMAFFERFGPDGLRELQRLGDMARERRLLVLLDGKRGDIGSTCQGYADVFFGPKSPYRADAVTAHAYLGFKALSPLTEAAAANGGAVFVVVLSSNPEGAGLQNARAAEGGGTVAEALAAEIAEFNAQARAAIAGAVMGATLPAAALQPVVSALDGALILTPGIGAQGATFADLEASMAAARRNVIPTASRSALTAGFTANALRTSIATAAGEARDFRREKSQP